MLVSELIATLQELQENVGDVPVVLDQYGDNEFDELDTVTFNNYDFDRVILRSWN